MILLLTVYNEFGVAFEYYMRNTCNIFTLYILCSYNLFNLLCIFCAFMTYSKS